MTTPITREGLTAVRTKPLDAQVRYLKEGGLDDALIAELTKDGKLDKTDTAFMAKRIGEAGNKANPAEVSLFNGLKALDAQDSLDASSTKTKTKPKTTKYPDVGPVADVESGKVTLKKGSGGPAVVEAQNLLEKAGYKEERFGSDGKFGPRTQAKVEEFQKANGLTVNGEIDAATLKKLQEVAKSKSPTPTTPVALSEQAKTDLTAMKAPTATAETFKASSESLQKEVGSKLDATGKTSLTNALDAARDARFGDTAETKKAAQTKFEASMKELEGKLDPAALASLRELVPAPKTDAPVPVKPTFVTTMALGNMKSPMMSRDAWDGNARTVTTDLMPKLDAQGQKDLQGALAAARDARYTLLFGDKMKAKQQFETYMKQLDAKLDPALAKALRELV